MPAAFSVFSHAEFQCIAGASRSGFLDEGSAVRVKEQVMELQLDDPRGGWDGFTLNA